MPIPITRDDGDHARSRRFLWVFLLHGGQRRIGGGRFAGAHRRPGRQELLFAVNQVAGVVGGQLKAVPVGDGVRGAGLYAVSAEDAAVVINVIDLGVTLGAADAVLFSVLGGLNVNAVGRAGGSAQETRNALFQAVLIALQHVQ